jgi:hypothetical protein
MAISRRNALKALSAVPAAVGFTWTPAEAEHAHQAVTQARKATAKTKSAFKPGFFTPHEWATVRVLVDLIIPKDERSGSATDAAVPEFMDFVMLMPGVSGDAERARRQTAMRGGLRWLDGECRRRFDKTFVGCTAAERTEVLEAEEYFAPGQKGSSAMPHKRNPVLTENLTGLARMVRAFALPAMENVVLWHERDISHSSVERMIGPDATITLDFALARLTGVVEKLLVYPDNMLKNMNKFRGLIHSQRVLLALTQAGVSREDAYRLVQRNAMKVWEQGADFLQELLSDREVRSALSEEEIREKFDLGYHTKHVDTIFRRVFGEA